MNMLEKLKAMESDENFEEANGELYESVFEGIDINLYVKTMLAKTNVVRLVPLDPDEESVLNEFMI